VLGIDPTQQLALVESKGDAVLRVPNGRLTPAAAQPCTPAASSVETLAGAWTRFVS
jgi:hypothetical protein